MTLSVQMVTMATMLAAGLGLGFCLDVYHVIKERVRLRGWVVTFIDLFYWIGAACLVFQLLMWCNWGELRFYIFLALGGGFFLYLFLLQPWMTRWIDRLLRLVTTLLIAGLRLLEKLLWLPLKYILRFFWVPCVYLVRWLQPLWQWKKER